MSDMKIILGNRNYSSWSLRPWLVMKHLGLDFDEIVVPLFEGDFKEELLKHSPSGKVPVLKFKDQEIWDSLAICEYLNEENPDAGLWPVETEARAIARSVSYEMHSGFFNIRNDMPMNIRRTIDGFSPSSLCQEDINRIIEIWTSCRQRFGQSGPFLFGQFSIADAMFAPVVSRFNSYRIPIKGVAADYMHAILTLSSMEEWTESACGEEWVIEAVEL
ncbi:Glutathione S-transferase domain protein [Candidatus Terasakiella magnetica]|uniref:Glutathione S-transferase domain protein n=1 Tax=Candidatus Terasakiella magnetica TaxID=1867952 RepID=A0A1C3RDT8_9PROT|nr:glutathione S-transferase family protein [Candidatus Terasakiella magnetica]SCA55456.1 Glutathione S-transferase domain protein [Candidatus Terasakiella magnetica]